MSSPFETMLDQVRTKYSHQPTFLQAVEECAHALQPLFKDEANRKAFLVMTEPERAVSFRVSWADDQGALQHNRAWRVEFNSALGPYKGGLRFHPTVDEGVLKFLGFEQIFKNALTGLPMGGGKGGSDFDPKGKSDGEVLRFCQAFMTELYRHIGPNTDVPAGDIGVGGREIGYLFGHYKRIVNRHEGVLTGKGPLWGGSKIRPEATGYGCVYIAEEVLKHEKDGYTLAGKKCAVSGSGNVAQYCAEKLLELGAHVISMSDSSGTLYWTNDTGMSRSDLDEIMEVKNVKRGRLGSVGDFDGVSYVANKQPWQVLPDRNIAVDLCFPCATQNEITGSDANRLINVRCQGVFEGANMPCTREAQQAFKGAGVVYLPGKAANAGGVAVSGLEMTQNSQRLPWTREEVDAKLKDIMVGIYQQCKAANPHDLEAGANIAAFLKVKQAMQELGWC